jgi:hypothetical protein
LSKELFSQDFFWSKVDRNGSNCWLWKCGHFGTGYGAFKIGKKNYGAHVIAFLVSGGKLTEEKNHVLHSCNNRGCVNPAHLRAGSQQDNVDDAMKNGNHGLDLTSFPRKRARGTKHGMAILTDAKVRSIRSEYEPYKMTRNMLSRKYGVSTATIQLILARKLWKHVE